MVQSASSTSNSRWEHNGLSYGIGAQHPFVISMSQPERTKPFGLVSKNFDLERFIEEHHDDITEGKLFIWSRIVDLKIDRRGRVYPIIEPITSLDRLTVERCGADHLLRKEDP